MRRKRGPTLSTKLRSEDHAEFERIVRLDGRKKTAIVREAILLYVTHSKQKMVAESEGSVSNRATQFHNELVWLLTRVGIGVYAIYRLLWWRTPEQTRTALFAECEDFGCKSMQGKQ